MLRDRYSNEELLLREFLRENRKKAGLNQAELADRLGVPQSFVSKYESGERLLSFIEVMIIIQELKVEVGEIVKKLHDLENET